MSPEVIQVLNSLPLHVILMIGIIVLWRDNKELRSKLENVRQVAASTHALTLQQNTEIAAIKAQTCGEVNQRL